MTPNAAFNCSCEPLDDQDCDDTDAHSTPPTSFFDVEGVAGDYRVYRAALARLAGIVRRTRGAAHLETKADAAEEMQTAYAVQAFLARRSFELRRQLCPTIFKYALDSADPEAAADRGDLTALLYYAAVDPSGMTVPPTNWTVVYEPWRFLRVMTFLLSDLHHLADRGGLNWPFLLRFAERVYNEL